MKKTKATIIVLEGPEASGKTTTTRSLMKAIQDFVGDKKRITHLREPGGTTKAEEIRREILENPDLSVKIRAELFSKARMYMIEEYQDVLSDENSIVLMDRSFISTFVYQGYAEDETISFEDLMAMNEDAMKKLRIDHLFILSGNIEVLQRRIGDRNSDDNNFFDMKSRLFHEKVNEGYLSFLNARQFYGFVRDYVKDSTFLNTTDFSTDEIVMHIMSELERRNLL